MLQFISSIFDALCWERNSATVLSLRRYAARLGVIKLPFGKSGDYGNAMRDIRHVNGEHKFWGRIVARGLFVR